MKTACSTFVSTLGIEISTLGRVIGCEGVLLITTDTGEELGVGFGKGSLAC